MKAFNCTPYNILTDNIVKAEGCCLHDDSGKRYIDLESGVWCTSIGHNHHVVNKAIAEQMKAISHVGYRYSHRIVEQAADMMLSVLKMEQGKCVFLSSGSEAVEFAVQASKKIAGKTKPYLLCLEKHFLSSYGQASSRISDEWISIDLSQMKEHSFVEELEKLPFDEIGAFIFEPGNASGLVHLPSKEIISFIVKKVKENGGLIVVDEVTTGVGRTGKWFGFEHYDIIPDIVACGKGIGNGYPVSCVSLNDNLAEKLLDTGFRYAQSHQNDPLGCAVMCAVISHISNNRLIEKAEKTGRYFINRLKNLAEKYDYLLEARGRGLMIAISLSPNLPIKEIHQKLFDEGFIVGLNIPNHVLRLYPPLVIEQQTLDKFIYCFEKVLNNY